jgi:hypothetical protein
MSEIRCSAGGVVNRVPDHWAGAPARCGKCRAPLATAAAPVALTDASFEDVVLRPLPRSYAGRVVVAKLDVDANPTAIRRARHPGVAVLRSWTDRRSAGRCPGTATIEAHLAPLLAAAR